MRQVILPAELTGYAVTGSLFRTVQDRVDTMGISISLDLTDRDLGFFRHAVKQSRNAVRGMDEAEIIEAIRSVLDTIKSESPLPDFVARKLPDLDLMIAMLLDDEWRLPQLEREHLLATFVYFGDPEDIIPDDIPAIGYLDDVILIELLLRDLRHTREAYSDFCRYRDEYSKNPAARGTPTLKQRLAAKRKQLHARMKRRQIRDKKTALW
ncbi:MAG: YkvA family protein [Woeseiaceae bacterium]